jgi:hypothetical protein
MSKQYPVNHYYLDHKEEIDELLGISEPKKYCKCGLLATKVYKNVDYCLKHMPN